MDDYYVLEQSNLGTWTTITTTAPPPTHDHIDHTTKTKNFSKQQLLVWMFVMWLNKAT